MIQTSTKNKSKPFLRWAGGKTWLLETIQQLLPEQFNDYYEPFLGGGSVFLHLQATGRIKNDVFLSDLNLSLINCYEVVRDSPDYLIYFLKSFTNSSENYYFERNQKYTNPVKEAARFIFLNRTSFNGIYRENLKGEYNVPYGHKSYKALFDYENIQSVSASLRNVQLNNSDFKVSINKAKRGDLLFIDPPYTVAHENNGFVKYNQKIFSWEDQIRLRDSIVQLEKKGAYFILTNAYHASLLELYDSIGTLYKVQRYSVVGGNNAKRGKYHEMIISNVNKKTNP